MDIRLVGCSKTKSHTACLAKDFYTSPPFRLAFAYAKASYSRVFSLSARYGLLHPEDEVRPYDMCLNSMSVAERNKWGERVAKQVMDALPASSLLYIHAGRNYASGLIDHLPGSFEIEIPLASLSIGEQLRWYMKQMAQAA